MSSSNQPHHDIFITVLGTATCKARQFGYSARQGILQSGVAALFGLMGLSSGQVKRMCTILRWTSSEERVAEKLRHCRRECARCGIFRERLRASLSKKIKEHKGGEKGDGVVNIVVLSGASAPAAVVNILNKGTKYSSEPLVRPPEMQALVRQVSQKRPRKTGNVRS